MAAAWMLLLLAASLVVLGTCALVDAWAGDRSPPPPHHDFAGPTDPSGLTAGDLALISFAVIVLGCGLDAVGGWLRRTKTEQLPRAPRARVVRDT